MQCYLCIIPSADGYIITKARIPDAIYYEDVVAVREELGEKYEYPSDPDTVIGFVRDFMAAQAALLEKEALAAKTSITDPDKDIPF